MTPKGTDLFRFRVARQWIHLTMMVLCATLSVSTTSAQTAVQSGPAKNDAGAVAVVEKALQALGGRGNWQNIGAASASVTESLPDGKSVVVQWADDWHSDHVLWRRDASGPTGQPITRIADQSSHTRTADGKTRSLPREEDIAVLAVGYPAAALMLSLRRNDCALSIVPTHPNAGTDNSPDSNGPVVAEDCHAPEFPSTVRILWQFSPATGLPTRVRLPIRDSLHNVIVYQIVQFKAFSQQGRLVVPSSVTTGLSGGRIETLAISNWAFTSSLPLSTFAAPTHTQP